MGGLRNVSNLGSFLGLLGASWGKALREGRRGRRRRRSWRWRWRRGDGVRVWQTSALACECSPCTFAPGRDYVRMHALWASGVSNPSRRHHSAPQNFVMRRALGVQLFECVTFWVPEVSDPCRRRHLEVQNLRMRHTLGVHFFECVAFWAPEVSDPCQRRHLEVQFFLMRYALGARGV